MANIIFGGGASFGGGVQSNSPGSPPLQASVGTVTAITVGVNTAIQNFYPFSSVQYGISPYTYSVSSGTLPTGITIDSATGLVSGIPTATQSVSNVVFRVTDSLGVVSSTTATVAFTINGTITATANSITPVNITVNQSVGSFYPFASVTGGTTPYYYFVSSGTLPDRVTLDPTTGLVTGTPTQSYSTATVTFSVRDAGGIVASTTSTVSFTINFVITAIAGITTAVQGYQNSAITSFNPFINVYGGTTPYTYYIVSGTLPTGISLNSSTGLVSGTPTGTQTISNVIFGVKDANNVVATVTSTVSFTVKVAFVVTAGTTTTVNGLANSAITSFNPFTSVTGGYTPYTYYISSGTLPTGITLDSGTGLVSGTPTATQTASDVVFAVRDFNNTTSSTTLTVSFNVITYTVQYLVVAGGGAGGATAAAAFTGAGGGAGGFASGNAVAQRNITASLQVGAGGPASPAPSNGALSSISSPIINVSTPGGGRGSGSPQTPGAGSPGGSGGGTYWTGNGAAGLATGSPGQGVAGTYGWPGGNSTGCTTAGGGGGAGGVGSTGPASSTTIQAAPGGAAQLWPYTGVYYAGGGGAGSQGGPTQLGGYGGNSSSPSSKGGGGDGGTRIGSAFGGRCATPGTGGGGGGGMYNGTVGGSGAPGVVIIAVPTPAYYPTMAPGAIVSNPGSAPGYTVLTFLTLGPGSITF